MNEREYPVRYRVERLQEQNRLTVAFRIILAIPHLILVGGPAFVAVGGPPWWFNGTEDPGVWLGAGGGGLLGLAAFVVAVFAWFAILVTGRYPRSLWNFALFYLRWRMHAITYTALLRDEYPPFGEGEYPVIFTVGDYPEGSSRWRVALRIFLAIPHIIVVWFLEVAWFIVSVVAWFAILFTGRYPASIYPFAAGVAQWSLRLQAYLLLLRDEYPPFDFGQLAGPAVQPAPAS